MSLPPPTDVPDPERAQVHPRTIELIERMSKEEVALTLGLGVLVQRAAEVEYILHGLYAHLGNVERPYTDKPGIPVTSFIKEAKARLVTFPEDRIPAEDRPALLHDLDLCAASFDQRNRYIHSCWGYDEETHAWGIIKGTRGLDRPEICLVYSEDVWELADEFGQLCDRLTAWDARYFGTDLGEGRFSSKRF